MVSTVTASYQFVQRTVIMKVLVQ